MSTDALGFSGSLGWRGRKIWSPLPTEDTSVNGRKLIITKETLATQVCPQSPWSGYWLLCFAQPRIIGP